MSRMPVRLSSAVRVSQTIGLKNLIRSSARLWQNIGNVFFLMLIKENTVYLPTYLKFHMMSHVGGTRERGRNQPSILLVGPPTLRLIHLPIRDLHSRTFQPQRPFSLLGIIIYFIQPTNASHCWSNAFPLDFHIFLIRAICISTLSSVLRSRYLPPRY